MCPRLNSQRNELTCAWTGVVIHSLTNSLSRQVPCSDSGMALG